jgi:lysophospholipase L1-like esterase
MAGTNDIIGIAAAIAKSVPGTAGAAAVAAKEAAEAAADEAQEILESIPEDYSELSADVGDLKSILNGMTTATAEDEGKALKAKTVTNGKVTEWEFGEAGGGDYDDVLANTIEVTSRTPALTITGKKTWIDSNGVATLVDNTMANYRASNACAVLPGDEVKLTFQPSNHNVGAKAILVTDADYNILTSIDAPSSGLPIVSHEFVVPATGAYFMLNVWASGSVSNFTITTTTKYPVALQKDLNAADSRIESLESFDAGLVLDTSATNNLMDYRPFAEGTISDQTGVFTPVVTPATYKYICSGFIPVEAGVTYYIRRTNGGSVATSCQGYYYYASDKSYVSGQTGNNTTYWNRWMIPDGVKFMRVFLYIGKGAESFDSIPEYAKTWGLFEYGTDRTKPLFVPLTTVSPELRYDFTVDTRAFAGKTIAILGDSIGTRKGYNDPEVLISDADVGIQLSAYLTNNDVSAELSINGHTYTSDEIGTEVTFTPTAEDVGKSIGVPLNHGGANDIRWWQMLCTKLGMTATNASWSGATMVSNESITTTSYKASCAWYESTIRRCGFRTPGTMTRVAPDYIFIHRGVNDFSNTHSGTKTVLTDDPFSAYNYAIPQSDQITVDGVTMYDFKQAYAMTIQKLRDAYPTAKIICCTIAPFRRHSETHFPPNNGRYNLPSFNKAIREVAEFFGCPVCEFAEAYTYEDLSSYSSDGTHPNEYGHRSMYERALLCLVNNAKVDC